MLEKQQAKKIVDTVVAASKADEVSVSINAGETTHLRFARNSPSTSGNFTDVRVAIESTFGTRSGTVSVNQIDEESLTEAVERSETVARLAPQDPEHVPALGPQSFAEVDAYRDEVVANGPEQIAAGVRTCIQAARKRDLVAAGFARADASASAIGNSAGLFGFHRRTDVTFSQTVRTEDGGGSGWASNVGNRVGDIDFASNAAVAIDKAMKSVEPRPLEPGKYVTILEPACVANLVSLLLFGMNARAADEGRSFFSAPEGGNKLGERLFPEQVSLYSDPADGTAPGRPWGAEYLPQKRRDWIEGGAVANLMYDRHWATKNKREPVPFPSNMIMRGGSGSVDDLVKGTRRGVLITSLWYIRSVDPRTMLYTGLTRDGVYWVEDGQIKHPVTNFRWNDSPVAVLKNIDAMSETVRVAPRSRNTTTVAVPALRVKEFELSSVSEAV